MSTKTTENQVLGGLHRLGNDIRKDEIGEMVESGVDEM
ncbi:MAG: hypothetical protein ACJA08_000990 [Cyclobacteriaceae bacterium]